MKKINIIKHVLPIIFLSLLLFLIPLFKTNYSNEYYCNYNLNDLVVTERYKCEDNFLNKYKIESGNTNDEITANGGNPQECINTINSLIDKLCYFYIAKSKISDISTCELSVAEEKIENLANLIKLKLLSIDSCEITYNQYEDFFVLDPIRYPHLVNNPDILVEFKDMLKEIKYFALRHSVKKDEELKYQMRVDRAVKCLVNSRVDVVNNNITDCSVKGNNKGDAEETLGLMPYNVLPLENTLNVDHLLK